MWGGGRRGETRPRPTAESTGQESQKHRLPSRSSDDEIREATRAEKKSNAGRGSPGGSQGWFTECVCARVCVRLSPGARPAFTRSSGLFLCRGGGTEEEEEEARFDKQEVLAGAGSLYSTSGNYKIALRSPPGSS